MSNFIFENYSNLILSVEVLAAITGVILYKKHSHTNTKYFIGFLCYVVLLSIVGKYTYLIKDGILSFLEGTLLNKNFWWFTLSWQIGAVYFFSWYYQKTLKTELNVKILKYSTYIFLLISLCIILSDLDAFFKGSFPLISIYGSFIILQCAFFYYFEILQSDAILSFHKSVNFYISTAILVFWLIKTPLVFYEMYLNKDDLDFVYLNSYINITVIYIMYLTFTVGLIVSKPEDD